MPILFFQLHFHFANSYVCVSKHFYAVPSSPALINIYRHMNTFGLYSVLYFLSAFFENLIETYVTVPIDTLITLLISLSSAFFCIYNFQFIRMCASTCIRIFPSSIFIYIYRIFICIYLQTVIAPGSYALNTPIIISLGVPAPTGWSRAHVWMCTPCAATKLE